MTDHVLVQTDATRNISQQALFEQVFAPIATHLGLNRQSFLSRMTNDDTSNSWLRDAWKFGASRGVSGTPTFAANGVIADELAGA